VASVDRDPADRLSDYLDAIAEGRADDDIDAITGETVRRFFARDDAPSPPDGLTSRIWEDLEQHAAAGMVPLRASNLAPAKLNGRAHSHLQGRAQATEQVSHPRWRGGRWLGAQFATVVLLLITALGIYRVGWHDDSRNESRNGAVIPAAASCGVAGSSAARGDDPVTVDVQASSPMTGDSPSVAFVWGSAGGPESPELVSHLAIDPQCRLWVMDHLGNRFLIFDLDGNLIEAWGAPGSGNGQFDFGGSRKYYSNGIAFAEDGGFYVSDAGNRRVQQFAADRTFVRAWSTAAPDGPTGIPAWIAVGPDGNVYVVTDASDGIVQIFTRDGELVRKISSTPTGDGRVLRIGPLAFDPDGNLWMLDPVDKTLVQVSLTGDALTEVDPPGSLLYPMGLAIDTGGRFYVTDVWANTVFVFDPDGDLLFTFGKRGLAEGQVLNPFSIALDGAGAVYVSEGGNPRIQKFEIEP
jgi:DNA-binding beta-propeller fold protein YncE